MWVTLYTDASLKEGVASWAIWARSSEGRLVQSGEYPGYCAKSDHAEAYAILMGIKAILAKWKGVHGIQVNSDSRNALDIVRYMAPTASDPVMCGIQVSIEAELGRDYNIDSEGVKLRAKWVKGHQWGGGVRAWLNNACDRIAKKARLGERTNLALDADELLPADAVTDGMDEDLL